MSSLSFCQELQSCLEPSFKEPHVLRLDLAPPKSIFSRSNSPRKFCFSSLDTEDNNTSIPAITNTKSNDCDGKSGGTADLGSWSFLQSVNDTSSKTETDKVYVHPLVKRAAFSLSSKSLEMCTESLCSETGKDQMSENGDDFSFFLAEAETEIWTPKEEPCKLSQSLTFVTKKPSRCASFPPPLTSVSRVQVRPHREGGRLVLEAVVVSPSHTYFHAERGGGRLRLSLRRDCSDKADKEEGEEEADEEEFEEESNLAYDEEEKEADRGEDSEENNKKIQDEIEGENLSWRSGCKGGEHGNKGLLNWEPYWVAT